MSSEKLIIAVAQMNGLVGDIQKHCEQVIALSNQARDEHQADIIVFPELTLTGYPPEDLLLHAGLQWRVQKAFKKIKNEIKDIAVVIGYPDYQDDKIYNAASFLYNGDELARYYKQCLPNYAVFDEKRYFTPGDQAMVVEYKGADIGLTICEDLWEEFPLKQAVKAGAEIILNINASPYHVRKISAREKVIQDVSKRIDAPIVYGNWVGGQDELVFDGSSLVTNSDGKITNRLTPFSEGILVTTFTQESGRWEPVQTPLPPQPSFLQQTWDALVVGTRDYVNKNRFPGIVLGLSGGIDSAVTLAIAVDALGADRVRAVMMPSKYTSDLSESEAARQAEWLGVQYDSFPIEGMYKASVDALDAVLSGTVPGVTEENIQARCRGVMLMAISNKTGYMVLTTGNKSEMAVGYCTLYGDMAGGYAPIKDCVKTLVYDLARYRNTLSQAIPEVVIERPPTAELRFDQKDSDSLPDYEILDAILEAFIEDDQSVEHIVAMGYDLETVKRVLHMVKRNEYKRRQAPPGVRISSRAFGKDWRYPITSGY
ncbi:MAG: NAD+ synthase [Gammaproteobacteria bacterium]|nr:NAD+ synthase [Gammaproteobacteria bacterium]